MMPNMIYLLDFYEIDVMGRLNVRLNVNES